MYDEVRIVNLEDGQFIDGIPHEPTIDEENDTIKVVVESRNFVKLEYGIDTPEGDSLLKNLTDDMIGQRTLIAKIPDDPGLRIALKRAKRIRPHILR